MSLCFLTSLPLSAKERKVRILLYSVGKPASIIITPGEGNVFINDKVLRTPATIETKGTLVGVKGFAPPGKRLAINITGRGAWLSGGKNPKRLYKGLIEVTSEKGRLRMINTVPLEAYIAGVVSGEASDLSLTEAFKAQAVAARTYALKHMDNHIKDGHNMCDSTHCQLFTGFAAVKPSAQAAADFTRGEIVTYRGKLAATFYHSVCGGRTEAMVYVWPFEHKPYLISVRDGPEGKPYCSIAPGFKWKTRVSMKSLTTMARAQRWLLPGENIRKMEVLDRGISKRAVTLAFSTEARQVKVSATNFYHGTGRSSGWNAIRSTFFYIYSGKDYVVFEGLGNGHGVGMCQWGAEGMARLGFRYRDILTHYYPGTEISHD